MWGWGKKTEMLLRKVLEDSGDYAYFDGSYNGVVDGVNGFDGVFIKGSIQNPTEVIINESKQFTGGSITLNGPATTGNGYRPPQMTDEWVEFVRDKLIASGKDDLALAINKAIDNAKLRKIVTVVDRSGSELNGGIAIIKVE
jgi:hypothetical protein